MEQRPRRAVGLGRLDDTPVGAIRGKRRGVRVMTDWREVYGCGCEHVMPRKKDLIGYCPVHGDSRVELYTEEADDNRS